MHLSEQMSREKIQRKVKIVKKRSKVMKKKVTLSTSQKIASLGSSGTSATKTTEAKICIQLLKVQTCLGYLVTFENNIFYAITCCSGLANHLQVSIWM